jgi:hypothetical protein
MLFSDCEFPCRVCEFTRQACQSKTSWAHLNVFARLITVRQTAVHVFQKNAQGLVVPALSFSRVSLQGCDPLSDAVSKLEETFGSGHPDSLNE